MAVNFDILIPEATKNLVLNPSVENDAENWVPEWNQEATFEDQELTPNPTGFDSTGGAGTLLISNHAAIRGDWGLEVDNVFAGGNAYGEFTDPTTEDEVVVEMYLDTNNIVIGAIETIRTIQAWDGAVAPFYLDIENPAAQNQFNLYYRTDAPANVSAGTYNVDLNTMYKIRVHWKASSGPGANDGFIRMYVNDALEIEATGIDNDTYDIETIRIGDNGGGLAVNSTIFIDNPRWADTDVPFTGCSVERTLERARFGRYSLRVYTDGYFVNEGVFVRVDTTNIHGVVTGSAYIRGSGKVRVRLQDGLTGDSWTSQSLTLNDRTWQRIEVTGISSGSDDLRLYIETAETAQEVTFYVDGAQIEEKDVATSYCDGTQPGCRWNGVAFKTTSERKATSMDGGRWTSIKEDDCDPDTYFTAMFGLGMPPITINRQRMALAPGAFFDSSRVEERPFGFTVVVKDREAQTRDSVQPTKIWELRQRLEDIFKPDLDPDNNPFWMRYRQDGKYLMIRALYEAGLEFEGDVRNKYYNNIPLRFLALDPFWYEDNQEVALIETEKNLDDVFLAAARVDGEWQEIAQLFGDTPGDTDNIFAIEEDANGRIYYGGSFTLDGDGNAMRRFCYLNNDYTELIEGASGFNGIVYDIKAHPNGRIYICGDFTFDGPGVTALNRIAEYDPETDTMTALGAGLNNDAYEMAIAPNGDVYVVGTFSTAGGIAVYRIARWDGGAWHRVGDLDIDLSLISATLNTIILRDDDDIYIGGSMAEVGNAIFNAQFDGTTWTEMGDSGDAQGAGGTTNVMVFDNDGTVIIGYSNDPCVHRWNGSGYVAMGDGLTAGNPNVTTLAVGPDGNIYAGGTFNQSGDVVINRNVAIFNGSTWTNFDFDSDAGVCRKVFARQNGDIYIGLASPNPAVAQNAVGSGISMVECLSTTETFAIVTFTGTGRILWLENQSAGVVSFFDYTLQEDEVFEVDYRTGIKTVRSNYRGSVPNAILPNSEDIFLLAGKDKEPSQNTIACLIIDEVEPVVQIRYQPTHWSVDAISTM